MGDLVQRLRASGGCHRLEAADRIERLEAEVERQTARGNNHWETLRGIREIARTSGDLERIVQWVSDAGSGYTATVEATIAGLMDERASLRARVAELEAADAPLSGTPS